MGTTQDIGNWGEDVAAGYLKREGFEILGRNWRDGRNELDIIAEKDGVLHIVEVKCRKTGSLTAPEDAITPAKFRSLQKAAAAYIEIHGIDTEIQFDVIAVVHNNSGGEIRYIPNAMIPKWQ